MKTTAVFSSQVSEDLKKDLLILMDDSNTVLSSLVYNICKKEENLSKVRTLTKWIEGRVDIVAEVWKDEHKELLTYYVVVDLEHKRLTFHGYEVPQKFKKRGVNGVLSLIEQTMSFAEKYGLKVDILDPALELELKK